VVHVDDAASERSGGSADPASLRISETGRKHSGRKTRPTFSGDPSRVREAGYQGGKTACTLWWPLFVRNRSIGPEVIGSYTKG